MAHAYTLCGSISIPLRAKNLRGDTRYAGIRPSWSSIAQAQCERPSLGCRRASGWSKPSTTLRRKNERMILARTVKFSIKWREFFRIIWRIVSNLRASWRPAMWLRVSSSLVEPLLSGLTGALNRHQGGATFVAAERGDESPRSSMGISTGPVMTCSSSCACSAITVATATESRADMPSVCSA
jgi:hypothetical protein